MNIQGNRCYYEFLTCVIKIPEHRGRSVQSSWSEYQVLEFYWCRSNSVVVYWCDKVYISKHASVKMPDIEVSTYNYLCKEFQEYRLDL